MKAQIQHGIKTGIIFGIVTLFLFMIGFLTTIADILLRGIKIETFTSSGITAQMAAMLIFLGLLGVWTGVSGARKNEPDSWGMAIVGGVTAGLVHGLMAAGTAALFGTLNARGISLTEYLAAMLPAVIKLFMLSRDVVNAAVTYILLMTLTGLVGALLARGVIRSEWRGLLKQWVGERKDNLLNGALISKIRSNKLTQYIVYGVLIILVLLIPLQVGQYWNYTLGTVGIYVLLGLGLNIVVGMAGLLNLGYVAFFAIGAYTMALLTAPEPHNLQWSFWAALPIAIILSAVAGVLLGVPVLRTRGDYLAIVTLAFGEMVRIMARSDILTDFTGGPRGVRNIGQPALFGRPFNSDVAFVFLITLGVILVIFITQRLQNSRVGRAWVAMREDETVAQAMGINTMVHKLLAFSIGAALAGLGGAIFASRNLFTGPEDHSFMVSINVLAVVIVGGIGSIPGVIAGAFALKGLPEILRELDNYRIMVFGALLVVMMIMRPEGLIPSPRQRLESKEEEAAHAVEDAPKKEVEVVAHTSSEEGQV